MSASTGSVRTVLFSFFLFFSLVGLTSAETKPSLQEGIIIRGSTSTMPFVSAVVESYMTEYPDTLVTVRGEGSLKGIKALIDGTADIAMSSTEITEELLRLSEEKNVELIEKTVAKGAIIPIVHSSRKLFSLSLQQLKDIFTGKIKDWSEVGSTKGPISVVTYYKYSGTFQTWMKKVIGQNAVITPDATVVDMNTLKRYIEENKGAIGYIALGSNGLKAQRLAVENIRATVKTVQNDSYPIVRNLILYYRSDSPKRVLQLLEYFASEQGQHFAEITGNIPAGNNNND